MSKHSGTLAGAAAALPAAARLALLAVAALAAGCNTVPATSVHQPMSTRPAAVVPVLPADGAIYHAGVADRPLFEDRRARNVGDTLVVVINEKVAASKKSGTTASRNGTAEISIPSVLGLPGKSFQGASLSASAKNEFEGKGDSSANNAFTGTIAVTVIEVLPNGNLIVSGEKQMALNEGTEFVRFSGVVNPRDIAGNAVSSTLIADARMEYRQNGIISEAQTLGWLARFFLSFLPF